MKRIHLLCIESEVIASEVDSEVGIDAFRSLIEAVRADGGRVGWLRWRPVTPSRDEALVEAAAEGLLRRVEVDASGSVARKPRSGAPVLRDVVREHFRGCRLVLVAGEPVGELAELPRLSRVDGEFRVEIAGAEQIVTATELASRLRRPAPF